jgi:hypothetical protein
MKQEILEMHKRLQPLYKKMMGEWIPKDGVYQGSFREGFIVRTHSKRGVIIADVYYKSVDTVMVYDVRTLNDLAIRLPLPIDPVNPSRGLLGMLNRDKYHINIDSKNVNIVNIDTMIWVAVNADPEEALLKALLEQEGL